MHWKNIHFKPTNRHENIKNGQNRQISDSVEVSERLPTPEQVAEEHISQEANDGDGRAHDPHHYDLDAEQVLRSVETVFKAAQIHHARDTAKILFNFTDNSRINFVATVCGLL